MDVLQTRVGCAGVWVSVPVSMSEGGHVWVRVWVWECGCVEGHAHGPSDRSHAPVGVHVCACTCVTHMGNRNFVSVKTFALERLTETGSTVVQGVQGVHSGGWVSAHVVCLDLVARLTRASAAEGSSGLRVRVLVRNCFLPCAWVVAGPVEGERGQRWGVGSARAESCSGAKGLYFAPLPTAGLPWGAWGVGLDSSPQSSWNPPSTGDPQATS